MEYSGVPKYADVRIKNGAPGTTPTVAFDFIQEYIGKKTVVISVADMHSLRVEMCRLLNCVQEILLDKDVQKIVVVFNGDIAPRSAIRFAEQHENISVFLISEFQILLRSLQGLFSDNDIDGHIIVNIGNHDVQSFLYFVQLLEICKNMNVPVLSHIPQAFDFDANRILQRAKLAQSLVYQRIRSCHDIGMVNRLMAQLEELNDYITHPRDLFKLVMRAIILQPTIKRYHRIGNMLFVGYCTSSIIIGGGDEGGLPIMLHDDWYRRLHIMGGNRNTCVIDDRTMQIIDSAILGTQTGIRELYEESDSEHLYLLVVAHEFFSTLPIKEHNDGNVDRLKVVLGIVLPAALEGWDLSRLATKVFCGHDHISYMFGRVPFTVNGQSFLVDVVGSSGYSRRTLALQVVGQRKTPVIPTASGGLAALQMAGLVHFGVDIDPDQDEGDVTILDAPAFTVTATPPAPCVDHSTVKGKGKGKGSKTYSSLKLDRPRPAHLRAPAPATLREPAPAPLRAPRPASTIRQSAKTDIAKHGQTPPIPLFRPQYSEYIE
jgi:hypothetical protein